MATTEPIAPAPTDSRPQATSRQTLLRWLGGLALLGALTLAIPRFGPEWLDARFQTFVTIFMGIFIEAVPFLLAGSIVSGLIEQFVDKSMVARLVPKRPLPAAFVGSLLGFTFPVCECGVVPVTRRLYQKGLPMSVGISFLLAAPVINPIVLLSTYAAFGWGPILIGRFVFTIVIAFAVGLLFSYAKPDDILRPDTDDLLHDHAHGLPSSASLRERLWQALTIAGDDFMDMARYLILGSMLAAAMQTLVPQSALLALGGGPVVSIVVLMVLAFVLSICSTVDAFVALSFVNSFTPGSILAFLVFGPMVDIKSALMFLGVFKRRVVGYLIMLPLLLTLLITVFLNLNVGW